MHIEPKIVAYSVCALPEDEFGNYLSYEIKVERTHHTGTWAVRWMGRSLSVTEEWDWEPLPSSRDDDWLADHRFGLTDALDVAARVAPSITVNGISAATRAREVGA